MCLQFFLLVAAVCNVADVVLGQTLLASIKLSGSTDLTKVHLIPDNTSVTAQCEVSGAVGTCSYAWYYNTDCSTTVTVGADSPNLTLSVVGLGFHCLSCRCAASGSTATSDSIRFHVYAPLASSTATFDFGAVANATLTCGINALASTADLLGIAWSRQTTGTTALSGSTSTNTTSTLVVVNSTAAGDRYYCRVVPRNASAIVFGNSVLATYDVFAAPYAEMYAFGKLQYTEGDAVNVSCKVLGYPTPNATWKREGVAFIPLSVNTVPIPGGYNASFDIASLSHVSDRGEYTCTASAGNRTFSSVKTLHARSKLAPLWPAIGILAQLAVVAIVIGITESVRTKKALAVGGKGEARLDSNKKSADNVVDGGSGDAVTGKQWKSTM